jgi:type VI secretion system protein ImpG
MEKLLPYYERELGMLRRAGQEFAARYPKLAGSLQISGETCADPHVERLIQATAFLNARVARLLDDGYSGFTEALLGMLYPHYLRPFPSCSVARIDYSGARPNEISNVIQLPRGSEMKSRSHNGVICRFRTAYDVTLAPIAISTLQFDPIVQVPPSLRLPADVVSAIRITIDTTSSAASLPDLALPTLRAFIDGEASLSSGLRDALFMHTACAFIEIGGQWRMLEKTPITAAGFADSDALLSTAPSEHAAYRLLSEYFAFPEKFDFIDIDLASLLAHAPANCGSVTLTLGLAGIRPDSSAARILRMLSPDNLVLSCTPIVNLFSHTATPVRITHTQSSYPLMPDEMSASASDIYSIDGVQLLRKTESGSVITDFHPYYSLRHGQADSRKGRYWLVRRDEELEHGHSLSLVDRDFNPLELESGTASIKLTCTNRNLPHLLRHGQPGGDLNTEAAIGSFPIRLLRRPTATHHIHFEGGAHWGLIAHLALNHRSLTQEGLPALAAMLRLYAQPDSIVAQRQIDGICALEHRPSAAWLRQREGAAYLRGIEVQITLDEEAYAGTGIHVFAQLLDHLFALHVHLNSFTQLIVLSKSNGKELLRCPPRNGSLALA